MGLPWEKVGKSCAELWGCTTPSKPIPVYASSISRKRNPGDIAASLMKLRASAGICAFKVKIGKRMGGTTLEEDQSENIFAAIEAAAAAANAECLVAFDANGAYDDVETADRVVAKLQSFGKEHAVSSALWFIEEPFVWFDHDKSIAFRKKCKERGVVVAGGEQESRHDIWKRLYAPAAADVPFDVCQPDAGYCGGPSIMLSIAAHLRTHHPLVKVVPHSPQPDFHLITSVHFMAAAPNAFSHMEVACVDDGMCQLPISSDGTTDISPVFCSQFTFRDGALSLPMDGYGWGVKVRADVISESIVRHSGSPSSIGFSPSIGCILC